MIFRDNIGAILYEILRC